MLFLSAITCAFSCTWWPSCPLRASGFITSQLFWSASLTKVTLSPSALTVPFSVFKGPIDEVLLLPMSQLLPISWARATVLNATQTATKSINSFFIEHHLLCELPREIKLLFAVRIKFALGL